MDKKHLIAEAYNDVYCKLAPSPIHGVGVFAIKDIPQNTIIFRTNNDWTAVDKKFLSRIDPAVAELYRQLLVDDENNEYIYIPSKGFSTVDMSFYVNHSTTPNSKYDASTQFIISKRPIKVGEEVTFDYRVHGVDYDFI